MLAENEMCKDHLSQRKGSIFYFDGQNLLHFSSSHSKITKPQVEDFYFLVWTNGESRALRIKSESNVKPS